MNDLELGAAVGENGFAELVAAFYRRVREDDLLSPMYPQEDWDGAELRLREFLIFRFGLSDRYIQQRGHPRLRMRHAPFSIGDPERDRWLELMGLALDETAIPEDTKNALKPFFSQVADFMKNQ